MILSLSLILRCDMLPAHTNINYIGFWICRATEAISFADCLHVIQALDLHTMYFIRIVFQSETIIMVITIAVCSSKGLLNQAWDQSCA